MITGIEWAVVAGVVALMFFFGKNKVVDWAKAAGQAKKAFDDAQKGVEEEKKE